MSSPWTYMTIAFLGFLLATLAKRPGQRIFVWPAMGLSWAAMVEAVSITLANDYAYQVAEGLN